MRFTKSALMPSKIADNGFTLIELLVVISIIAMLMGILMPALSAARRAAYKVGCKQNLHGCAIAFKMYLDDNRNIMPAILNMPNDPSAASDTTLPLYEKMKSYLSGPEALKCPADPAAKFFREQGSSYEYNIHLENKNVDKTWFAKRFGTNEVWVLKDYDPWHARNTEKPGAVMYLYADTLVADRERQ